MNLDCVWLTKLSMFCRYEVRCSLCKASIASKLDTIEKHEQSEKHVEMLGNQRTCIFRGDAGHRIAQAKLHAARHKHDRGNSGWELLEAMGEVTQKKLMSELKGATFMSLSLDEASQHNISVMSVHAYIINKEWK